MNQDQALKLTNQIWQSLFNQPSPFASINQLKNLLAKSIPLPYPVASSLSGKTTFITPAYFPTPKKFIGLEEIKPKKPATAPPEAKPSPESLIQTWLKNYLYVSSKIVSSNQVAESDNIYYSVGVYNSCYLFKSQNIVCCRQLGQCQNLIASYNNEGCTNSIRLSESLNSSYCFEVSWSNKISRSFFIHNSYDLYECLFCYHLSSKKYCIANIQFPREQYFNLKDQIITYLSQNNWQNLEKIIKDFH
ncbi:MAG: hypothetical protein GXP43_00195 [bacterium]|nr:hypothetical protein [bacterium]